MTTLRPHFRTILAAVIAASPVLLFGHGGIDDDHPTPTPAPTTTHAPVVTAAGGLRQKTFSARHVLRGRVANPGSAKKIVVGMGRRTRSASFRGGRWRVALQLKPGRNRIRVWAVTTEATTTRPIKLLILRKIR